MAYLDGLAKPVLLADVSNVANSAADVPVLGANIPAGVLVPGALFQVRSRGLVSNALLSSTFNFWVKLNGTKILTCTMTTPLLGQSNIPWWVDGVLTMRAGGVLQCSLRAESPATATNSMVDAKTTISSSVANVLTFGFNWTTANAANIITANQALIAAL